MVRVRVAEEVLAVTYHLMPLYFNPKLQAAVPPELRPRKQGKTCFNFQRPDASLFAMPDQLTRGRRDGLDATACSTPARSAPQRLQSALRAAGEDPERLARFEGKGKQAAAKSRGDHSQEKSDYASAVTSAMTSPSYPLLPTVWIAVAPTRAARRRAAR